MSSFPIATRVRSFPTDGARFNSVARNGNGWAPSGAEPGPGRTGIWRPELRPADRFVAARVDPLQSSPVGPAAVAPLAVLPVSPRERSSARPGLQASFTQMCRPVPFDAASLLERAREAGSRTRVLEALCTLGAHRNELSNAELIAALGRTCCCLRKLQSIRGAERGDQQRLGRLAAQFAEASCGRLLAVSDRARVYQAVVELPADVGAERDKQVWRARAWLDGLSSDLLPEEARQNADLRTRLEVVVKRAGNASDEAARQRIELAFAEPRSASEARAAFDAWAAAFEERLRSFPFAEGRDCYRAALGVLATGRLSQAGTRTVAAALSTAVRRGHGAVLRLLFAAGVNPNQIQRSEAGSGLPEAWTPLTLAAYCGQDSVLSDLLGREGTEPQARVGGKTALHWAVIAGQRSTTELLLRNGATRTDRDDAGNVALCYAKSAPELFNQLLRVVCDAPERTDADWALLGRALRQIDGSELASLYRDAIVELIDAAGTGQGTDSPVVNSALVGAVSKGEHEVLELLCDFDADPNGEGMLPDGLPSEGRDRLWTPLTLASFKGDRTAVETLVGPGKANVNEPCRGMSPLYCAAFRGHADIVEALMQAKADVTAQTPKGWTALHAAVGVHSPATVEALLRNPAVVVDAITTSGFTPLHVAVATSAGTVVVRTLSSKMTDVADVLARNPGPGREAEYAAVMVEAAQRARISVSLELAKAASEELCSDESDVRSARAVASLLKGLRDGRAVARGLVSAIERDHRSVVALILALGGNELLESGVREGGQGYRRSSETESWTPLAYAVWRGREDIACSLLKANASANRAVNGCTPLGFAAEQGNLELVTVLVSFGADVPQGPLDERHPVTSAIKSGNAEVVRFLLDIVSPEELTDMDPNAQTLLSRALRLVPCEARKRIIEVILSKIVDTAAEGQIDTARREKLVKMLRQQLGPLGASPERGEKPAMLRSPEAPVVRAEREVQAPRLVSLQGEQPLDEEPFFDATEGWEAQGGRLAAEELREFERLMEA